MLVTVRLEEWLSTTEPGLSIGFPPFPHDARRAPNLPRFYPPRFPLFVFDRARPTVMAWSGTPEPEVRESLVRRSWTQRQILARCGVLAEAATQILINHFKCTDLRFGLLRRILFTALSKGVHKSL